MRKRNLKFNDRLYLDFETFSLVDLKKAGARNYVRHPSTGWHCLGTAYRGDRLLILPGEVDKLRHLRRIIQLDKPYMVAHNAPFDRGMWDEHMDIEVALDMWMCTLAKAFAYGLPGKLDKIARVLELPSQKDMIGKKTMLRLAKPKPDGTFWTYEQDPVSFNALYDYCMRDLEPMIEIDEYLRDMTSFERRVWLLDQKINKRGVCVDLEAVDCARDLVAKRKKDDAKAYRKMTGIRKQTNRGLLKDWLALKGKELDKTNKKVIKPLLKDGFFDKDESEALELFLDGNRTSLTKYQRIFEMAGKYIDPVFGDVVYRVCELLQYHAAHTGRFGGRGIQIQNFPRPILKNGMEIVEDIKTLSYKEFCLKYPNFFDALASALKAMIIASPGCMLYVADYKQIEARILAWLADDFDKLQRYYQGVDTYLETASITFGKKMTKEEHENGMWETERQFGKCEELGLGFGGGIHAFVTTSKNYYIDLRPLPKLILPTATADEIAMASYCYNIYKRNHAAEAVNRAIALSCDVIKQRWRAQHPKIKQYWKELQASAVAAIESRAPVECGRVTFFTNKKFLFVKLPSGRCLPYFKPSVTIDDNEDSDFKGSSNVSYYNAEKGYRVNAYGGYFAENFAQAISRDITVGGMLDLDADDYSVLFTVHDSLVSESDCGSVDGYTRILQKNPKWGKGIPIAVDVYESTRYLK